MDMNPLSDMQNLVEQARLKEIEHNLDDVKKVEAEIKDQLQEAVTSLAALQESISDINAILNEMSTQVKELGDLTNEPD